MPMCLVFAGWVSAGTTTTYTFNSADQLTQVRRTTAPAVTLATSTYDGDGERVTKTEGGVTVIYVRDGGGNVLAEYNASTGALIAEYVYVNGQKVCRVAGDGSKRYFHDDPLGTPRAITDSARAVVWRGENRPFGEFYASAGTGADHYTFTGHEWEDESALFYMHARYYDPSVGRFLSTDPVGGKTGDPQGWNRYSYVLNNPLRFLDRDGREVYLVGRALDMPWWGAPLRAGTHTFLVVSPTGRNIDEMSGRLAPGEGYLVLGGYQAQAGEPEGMMVSRQNFRTDVEVAAGRTPNRFFAEVQPPAGMSMEDFERAVVAAFDSYQGDYEYKGYPDIRDGEANCNCFSAGMLQAAGVSLGDLPEDLPMADPGWPDPMPLGGSP